jgi:hypothetical protein
LSAAPGTLRTVCIGRVPGKGAARQFNPFNVKGDFKMKRTLAFLSLAMVLGVTALAQTGSFSKAAYCQACCHGKCGQTCCKGGCTDGCCQSK